MKSKCLTSIGYSTREANRRKGEKEGTARDDTGGKSVAYERESEGENEIVRGWWIEEFR